MMRIATGLAFGGSIFAVAVGATAVAAADDLRPGVAAAPLAHEFAAQKKRPRVTIYPRRVYPGPYAKRQCYSVAGDRIPCQRHGRHATDALLVGIAND